ncbi:CDC50/LEM3 family [Zopfochytrium polystomum]|nr:CDC50/LEM3 family [Zopfochytrium polystomum]
MEKAKTKRPANTAFKQQRLKSWQPILTPKTVLPIFFAVGAIFIPLGVGLYVASDRVLQVMFDYTDCHLAPNWTFSYPITSASYDAPRRTCTIEFAVDADMPPPVFLYYRLTNFYQNHRRYVKSYDAKQLQNSLAPGAAVATNCNPLASPAQAPAGSYPWTSSFDDGAVIYPCGLIANSYFTDDISDLVPTLPAGRPTVRFLETGIAWPSDASKFQRADALAALPNVNTAVFPPPAWVRGFPGGRDFSHGYNASNFPDLGTMERFQVWMRPAGLPTFRKLWGRTAADGPGVAAGRYNVSIVQNFDVTTFGGTKSIVISTVSFLGGKNPFLGAAYVVVGVVCWVLGLVFLLRHMAKPRKLGDYNYLSWNQTPKSAGEHNPAKQ